MKNKIILATLFITSGAIAASDVKDLWSKVDKLKDSVGKKTQFIFSNPLISTEYEEVSKNKNPHNDSTGKGRFIFGGDEGLKSLEEQEYGASKQKLEEINALKRGIADYEKTLKEYDQLTNDPRVIKRWREDDKNRISLMNESTGKFDESNYNALSDDARTRLLKEYNNDRSLLEKDLAAEFSTKNAEGNTVFDSNYYKARNADSKFALAESEWRLKQKTYADYADNAAKKWLQGETDDSKSKDADHMNFAIDMDNAERDMHKKEVELYKGALERANAVHDDLRKQYDIDADYKIKNKNKNAEKSYSDLVRDSLHQWLPNQISPSYVYGDSLDQDVKKNFSEMELNAKKQQDSVRDLENSRLSRLWYRTRHEIPEYAKYTGNIVQRKAGLKSQTAQNIGEMVSNAGSYLYNLLPSVFVGYKSGEGNNYFISTKEAYRRYDKFREIDKRVDTLSAQGVKNLNHDEIKELYRIKYDLTLPFRTRREVDALLQQVPTVLVQKHMRQNKK